MENNNIETEENISIVEIVFEYLQYWKWFLISLIIFLLIGVGVILISEKKYNVTASILLNEEKNKGPGQGIDLDLNALGMMSTTNNIENEVAILSSFDLMKLVVDKLNLSTKYYVSTFLRKEEIFENAPFKVSYISTQKYLSEVIEFYIKYDDGKYELSGGGDTYNLDEKYEQLPKTIKINDGLILEFELSNQSFEEGVKYHVQINDPYFTAKNLGDLLNIGSSKTSSVITLSLLQTNTKKGVTILNEYIDQYNQLDIKVKNEIANNTAAFIDDRLNEISVELSDAEVEVVGFKQKFQITDLEEEAKLLVQQSGANEQKLMEVETQLNIISFVEDFVNAPINKLKVIPVVGVSDEGLAKIISEYNSKLLNSEILLGGMGDDNSMKKRLVDDLENMRKSISGALVNVKKTFQVSKNNLNKKQLTTQSKINSAPKQDIGLIEKIREQRIKENLFLFLMQKREETNLSIASTAQKARVIESPQDNLIPIAPKKGVILIAVLFLAIATPICVIYILNLLRKEIKNKEELEKLSKVPIIGQIAKHEEQNQVVLVKDKNSAIAEMFRSLRNNINFILKNKTHKIILVTSTTMAEGKTFVSINLAMSFALTGKKILLIGGDIRKPRLHNYVDIKIKKGLSDYLVIGDDWHDYINQSNLSENLDIMISGTIPPNPNELLMTPILGEFLQKVKLEYDIVIIDSAPVGLVSDSYLLQEYVDVTSYVVREGVTHKDALTFINRQKIENKISNMYLVFNGTSFGNGCKNGYGYGYGYGYDGK